MKEVMEKVLSHPRLGHCLPCYVLPAHLVKAQQEVLLSLNMSIDANKLVQSNMSLVNKNVMLIVKTLNVSESSTEVLLGFLGYIQKQ
jgi:hypothetical protein